MRIRLLLPLLLVCFLPAAMLHAGGKKPELVLRVYTQNEDPGARSIPLLLSDPDQTIHINAEPEVNEGDLEAAEPYGQSGVLLHFSRHAGLLLNSATMQKMGKILVVSLNGRIVYSPVIDTPLNETLLLPQGVTPQDMALIQAKIKANHRGEK